MSQNPDPLSVRKTYFLQVGDHHVKIPDITLFRQKLSGKEHFENAERYPDRHPDILTDRHKSQL